MRVVVIIPSRYGSTRFDGKPLARIYGRPMIQWVYQRALQANCVEAVHVATDDERIRVAVKAFGGNVIMTSSACRSGTDRVAEAAEHLGLGLQDVVINIQGDQPLVDSRSFDALVKPFAEDAAVKMSTLHLPSWMNVRLPIPRMLRSRLTTTAMPFTFPGPPFLMRATAERVMPSTSTWRLCLYTRISGVLSAATAGKAGRDRETRAAAGHGARSSYPRGGDALRFARGGSAGRHSSHRGENGRHGAVSIFDGFAQVNVSGFLRIRRHA